jgi:cellulose synthase (UDP-forming)
LLVVTGANTNATYLASTQINFQKNIRQFTGDAIVVDANNSHYGYRFKKNKYIDASLNKKELISKNSQLILYLGLAVLMLGILGATAVLVIRKQGLLNGGKKHV